MPNLQLMDDCCFCWTVAAIRPPLWLLLALPVAGGASTKPAVAVACARLYTYKQTRSRGQVNQVHVQ